MDTFSHHIYSTAAGLPENWDSLSPHNIFLRKDYLAVLETSAPDNMECRFIGIFKNGKLVATALAQFLDLSKLESFGDREHRLKNAVRNAAFRMFGSHVLFIGNNMLTGQNAFSFNPRIPYPDCAAEVEKAISTLKKIYREKGKRIHITAVKDFEQTEISQLKSHHFEDYYRFSTQPNMVFDIPKTWKSEADYVSALSKKYRDQYKRSRKRAHGIEKRKMHAEDLKIHEETLYDLYRHVADNSPFNTFFLRKDHFNKLKDELKENFLFYGYFLEGRMVGFNTLIRNGKVMDTYFLGYDDRIQKEKMLYLNMLYDMIAYTVNRGFSQIIFARTALEIKSSVGAVPVTTYGLIRHSNKLINRFMGRIFNYLEPKTDWQQRHPFKS